MHGARAAGRRLEVLDEARHALVLLLGVPEPPEAAEAPAVGALLRVYGHLRVVEKVLELQPGRFSLAPRRTRFSI